MHQRKQQRRRGRRDLLRRLERSLDSRLLPDYLRRIRSERNRSKLTGVVTAGAVYTAFFILGFTAWKFALLPEAAFAKLSWIMMIPASVVGALTWLIAANRREFPIREEAKAHIARLEGGGGTLWRYAPLLEGLCPEDGVARRALEQSRRGGEQIVPEDYIAAVTSLTQALQACDNVPSQLLEEVEAGLAAERR